MVLRATSRAVLLREPFSNTYPVYTFLGVRMGLGVSCHGKLIWQRSDLVLLAEIFCLQFGGYDLQRDQKSDTGFI